VSYIEPTRAEVLAGLERQLVEARQRRDRLREAGENGEAWAARREIAQLLVKRRKVKEGEAVTLAEAYRQLLVSLRERIRAADFPGAVYECQLVPRGETPVRFCDGRTRS
jgi:hypothetical protein